MAQLSKLSVAAIAAGIIPLKASAMHFDKGVFEQLAWTAALLGYFLFVFLPILIVLFIRYTRRKSPSFAWPVALSFPMVVFSIGLMYYSAWIGAAGLLPVCVLYLFIYHVKSNSGNEQQN